jgi:hypothetical protein
MLLKVTLNIITLTLDNKITTFIVRERPLTGETPLAMGICLKSLTPEVSIRVQNHVNDVKLEGKDLLLSSIQALYLPIINDKWNSLFISTTFDHHFLFDIAIFY